MCMERKNMRSFFLFLGWSLLWTIPLSLIFAIGTFTASSIIAFTVLSLAIPIVLKRAPYFKSKFDGLPWSDGHYFYSWLFWNVIFFMGNQIIPFGVNMPDKPWQFAALWAVFMAILVAIFILGGIIFHVFFNRPKMHPIVDDILDIVVYSLPVPIIFIGNVLYINFNDPIIRAGMTPQLAMNIQLTLMIGVYGLAVWTIGAIIFYLYPRGEVKKAPRLVRILVTAVLWLAINAHMLFGGYIPPFVLPWIEKALPVFRGNGLVYITPAIFEIIVIAVSIVIAYYIEKMWLNALKKKELAQ